MVKRITLLSTLIGSLVLLSGCWDFMDVDERSIALSAGYDYNNEQYFALGEFANISADRQAEEQGETTYIIYDYGKTLESVIQKGQTLTPQEIFQASNRVTLLGPGLCKQGLEMYINRSNKFVKSRKSLRIVVTREIPLEYYDFKIRKEKSVGDLIYDILENLNEKGQIVCPCVGTIFDYITLGNVGYVLPYFGLEGNDIQYLGLAVMKDSKMIDAIPQKESEGIFYIIAERPVVSMIEIKKDENSYPFQVVKKKISIKTDYKNNTPIINIDLSLSASLQYQYKTEPISDDEYKNLEKQISAKVKESIKSIIKKAQEEYESDIFIFAKYFRSDNPDIYKEIDWKKEFTNAQVNVKVKTNIANTLTYDPNAEIKF